MEIRLMNKRIKCFIKLFVFFCMHSLLSLEIKIYLQFQLKLSPWMLNLCMKFYKEKTMYILFDFVLFYMEYWIQMIDYIL